jgi:hypothetical protein
MDRSAGKELEQARDRFLDVPGWTELLALIEPPAERPADPGYVGPFKVDPEPMAPSIDQHARVTLISGEKAIAHIRFQREYQANLGEILYKDSKRLEAEHHCTVMPPGVLLVWPGADGPGMTGEYAIPGGGTYRYHLTRLWERDVEEMFSNVAVAAFAPLSKFAPERLPEVIRRMSEVIDAEVEDEKLRSAVWVMAYTCLGLRYSAEQANELLGKERLVYIMDRPECRSGMSRAFYAGLSEGEQEGAMQATRDWVRTLGGQRLGEPPPLVEQALGMIDTRERLDQLATRVLKAASWPEVMAPS